MTSLSAGSQVRGTIGPKTLASRFRKGRKKKNLMVLAPWRGRSVAGKNHRARLASVSVECLVYGLVMKNTTNKKYEAFVVFPNWYDI